MSSWHKILFGALLCFWTEVPTYCEPEDGLQDWRSLLKDLQGPDAKVRKIVKEKLHQNYDATVSELLQVAEKANFQLGEGDGTKELAIFLLGHLRSEKAVDFLIRNITLNQPNIFAPFNNFCGHPCVSALVAIGNPASESALREVPKSIANDNRDNRTYWLLTVIHALEGYEVGKFMLERARDSAKTLEERETYTEALKMFETTNKYGIPLEMPREK